MDLQSMTAHIRNESHIQEPRFTANKVVDSPVCHPASHPMYDTTPAIAPSEFVAAGSARSSIVNSIYCSDAVNHLVKDSMMKTSWLLNGL
jgi:hypothetical protein